MKNELQNNVFNNIFYEIKDSSIYKCMLSCYRLSLEEISLEGVCIGGMVDFFK